MDKYLIKSILTKGACPHCKNGGVCDGGTCKVNFEEIKNIQDINTFLDQN